MPHKANSGPDALGLLRYYRVTDEVVSDQTGQDVSTDEHVEDIVPAGGRDETS